MMETEGLFLILSDTVTLRTPAAMKTVVQE